MILLKKLFIENVILGIKKHSKGLIQIGLMNIPPTSLMKTLLSFVTPV